MIGRKASDWYTDSSISQNSEPVSYRLVESCKQCREWLEPHHGEDWKYQKSWCLKIPVKRILPKDPEVVHGHSITYGGFREVPHRSEWYSCALWMEEGESLPSTVVGTWILSIIFRSRSHLNRFPLGSTWLHWELDVQELLEATPDSGGQAAPRTSTRWSEVTISYQFNIISFRKDIKPLLSDKFSMRASTAGFVWQLKA
jgi:hypothetical protein